MEKTEREAGADSRRELWESLWRRDGRGIITDKAFYFIRETDMANKDVLEIGCGNAEVSSLLMDKVKSYVGLDISEEALERARKLDSGKNLTFVRADALKLPFPEGSFDTVFSIETFPLLADDSEKAMREAKRVLRVGGAMIFDVTHSDWLKATFSDKSPIELNGGLVFKTKNAIGKIISYNEEGMRRALDRMGFDAQETKAYTHLEFKRLGVPIYEPVWVEQVDSIKETMLVRALRR